MQISPFALTLSLSRNILLPFSLTLALTHTYFLSLFLNLQFNFLCSQILLFHHVSIATLPTSLPLVLLFSLCLYLYVFLFTLHAYMFLLSRFSLSTRFVYPRYSTIVCVPMSIFPISISNIHMCA